MECIDIESDVVRSFVHTSVWNSLICKFIEFNGGI